jgi:hypothetical protein
LLPWRWCEVTGGSQSDFVGQKTIKLGRGDDEVADRQHLTLPVERPSQFRSFTHQRRR